MSAHAWRHVRWLQGISLERCVCGVERTRQESTRSTLTQQARRTVYRRQGQEEWGRERLAHVEAGGLAEARA